MILGIQLLGVLFALFMIYINFLHYKRKEFTVKEYFFWIITWVVFMIVSVFPGILNPIVESLNLARTMDLLIISGFLFLIAAIFYTYTVVRRTQKKLEDLVRNIAMKKK